MKKSQISNLFVAFSLILFILSYKENAYFTHDDIPITIHGVEKKQNEATWMSYENKDLDGGPWFRLKFLVGHTAAQCGGGCIRIFGTTFHIDCVGFGEICNHTVNAELSKSEEKSDSDYYTLTLEGADDLGKFLEYSFSDRTFFITNPQNNTELWLNIPEQVLVRKDFEDLFIIHNVWFSEAPELENK